MKPRCHWQESWVQSLVREDPLEKGMASYFRTPTWRIPWMGDPERRQFMRSQRAGHDWASNTFTFKPMLHTESFTLQYLSYHYFSHFSPNVACNMFPLRDWVLGWSESLSEVDNNCYHCHRYSLPTLPLEKAEYSITPTQFIILSLRNIE